MKVLAIILLNLVSITMTKLIVYHPYRLREKIDPIKGEIGSSLANFGNIPYGQSIIGRVWYDADNDDG